MISNFGPHENHCITIHLVVQHEETILKDDLITFYLGFGYEIHLPLCIEEQVLNLSLAETTTSFQCEWNESWSSFLPAHTNMDSSQILDCKIEVKNMVKPKEIWEMNEDQKLEFSEKMRTRGNFAVKHGDLKRGYRCYKSVIRTLEDSVSVTENRSQNCKDVLFAAYLNAAHCLLKGEQYSPCIRLCSKALQLQGHHVKALYRRAKAHMALTNFKDAEKDIQQCLHMEPNSSLFKRELAECRQLLSQSCQKEATLYKKMFSKLGSQGHNDSDEMPWTKMDEWSNELADQMMSLPEELEAFGEKMPELKPISRKSKSFPKIEDPYIES